MTTQIAANNFSTGRLIPRLNTLDTMASVGDEVDLDVMDQSDVNVPNDNGNQADDAHLSDSLVALRPSNEQLISNENGTNSPNPLSHALSTAESITPSISTLFILVGLGPSWLLADSMFVEIPYWQSRQPEGLSLANKMTISGIMPLVTVVPIYFMIIHNVITPLSFRKITYSLIVCQFISCILISIAWSVTIGNISIIIHFVTFSASLVGHMMLFAVVPWVCSINNKLSAPILTGTNLGTLCGAVTGLIQQPGSDDPLFGPSVFFILWTLPFLVSLTAFAILDWKYLKEIESVLSKRDRTKNQIRKSEARKKYKDSKCPLISMLWSPFSVPVWWRKIWKFAALNAYIQWVTWVFIRSSIPFAVRNASSEEKGENTQIEQYAIGLSLVAVLVGSTVSMFIEIKQNKYFMYWTVLYSVFAFVFLMVAVGDNGLWVFWGSEEFVVVLVVAMRLIDGYLSPLICQNIAIEYPDMAHEMIQWISATAAVAAFVGVWMTYLLVQYHVL